MDTTDDKDEEKEIPMDTTDDKDEEKEMPMDTTDDEDEEKEKDDEMRNLIDRMNGLSISSLCGSKRSLDQANFAADTPFDGPAPKRRRMY